MRRSTVFGKYLLLERISVGGMAEVFVAVRREPSGPRQVIAIKRILPTLAEDVEFISMFLDEARITAHLNHPNIVHIHELGEHEGSYFIAMEYVSGRDLRALIELCRRRGRQLDSGYAAAIGVAIARGLHHAHTQRDGHDQPLNIIHRDVSPQNILLGFDGDIKVIDFGIAKAANRSQQTQAGILKGKFGYMSPEQVRALPIDRRSDIFAVGVILYELLTGEKLFVGDSDFSVLERVREAQIPRLRARNPEIPSDLEDVVLRALAREPADRYQWASELADALQGFARPEGIVPLLRELFATELVQERERIARYETMEVSQWSIQPSGAPEPEAEHASSDRTQLFDPSVAFAPPAVQQVPVVVGPPQAYHGATVVTSVPPPVLPETYPLPALDETRVAPQEDNGLDATRLGGLTEFKSPSRIPPAEAASPKRPRPKRLSPTGDSKMAPAPRMPMNLLVALIAIAVVLAGMMGVALVYRVTRVPVAIQVLPEDASVTVGGKVVQNGAINRLPEGTFELVAAAPGHRPARTVLEITAGSRASVAFRLDKEPEVDHRTPARASESGTGTDATAEPPAEHFAVRFDGEPGIRVIVDGKGIGSTPNAVATLDRTSQHRYAARRDGFIGVTGTVAYSGSPSISIPIKLERRPTPTRPRKAPEKSSATEPTAKADPESTGRLACSSVPAGAEIWVDGRRTGRTTPAPLSNPVVLPAGSRTIQFRSADGKLRSDPQQVTIAADSVAKLVNVPLK